METCHMGVSVCLKCCWCWIEATNRVVGKMLLLVFTLHELTGDHELLQVKKRAK